MPVYKDEQRGTWYFKCNYRDWQGETRTKLKRGFAIKREAQQGEREFLDKQSGNMNMKLAAFVEVYFNDKGTRLKERSIMTKRTLIEITITAVFQLHNGYMASGNLYFREMENISYHVAAGHIDEELLRKSIVAILNRTFDEDEELKLEYFNAIAVEDTFYQIFCSRH